jgi:hypothetical protein
VHALRSAEGRLSAGAAQHSSELAVCAVVHFSAFAPNEAQSRAAKIEAPTASLPVINVIHELASCRVGEHANVEPAIGARDGLR